MTLWSRDEGPRKSYVVNGPNVPLDMLVPIINPLQAFDLRTVLGLTVAQRRVVVAQAFLGLYTQRWGAEIGVSAATMTRWLNKENALPLGGALRLARVIDQEPLLLFEDYEHIHGRTLAYQQRLREEQLGV